MDGMMIIFLFYQTQDHATGTLLIAEAGGVVTDIYGKPLDFSQGRKLTANRGVIATSGNINKAVLDAISRFTSSS